MSMAWGGHRNGQIPSSAMTRVDGHLFEREAARQLVPLRAAFKRRFGKDLDINDDYRPLWEQLDNWNKWVAYRAYLNGGPWAPWAPLAAYYGTSNHGWGKAADFGSGVQTFGTAEKKWMDKNAPKYGWHPTGNNFSRPEAWHFDYTGNPTIVAGDGHTVIEEEEEDENMLFIKAQNHYLLGVDDVETLPVEEARAFTAARNKRFEVVTSAQATALIQGAHRREARRLRKIAAVAGNIDPQPIIDALKAEVDQMCAAETGFSEQDAAAERGLDQVPTTVEE